MPLSTPNFALLAAWSMISACHGNGRENLAPPPPHECGGGFDDFVQRSARQPVHRNPLRLDQGDRRELENRRELAIQLLRRLPEERVKV